jgi:hypothetical protein
MCSCVEGLKEVQDEVLGGEVERDTWHLACLMSLWIAEPLKTRNLNYGFSVINTSTTETALTEKPMGKIQYFCLLKYSLKFFK